MAFITLDDWTVPVISGGEFTPQRIGSEARAFSGRMIRDFRNTKRVWRYTTSTLAPEVANALVGLIEGQGEIWLGDWEDAAFSDETQWSAKGLASNTSGTEAFGLRANVAADGAPIVDASGFREGMYGSNSALAIDPETSNLLSDDASDCENVPSGFASLSGAILSSSSTQYVQGSKSLYSVGLGAGDGWYYNPSLTISGASTYTGLAYVYATSVMSLTYMVRSGNPNTIKIQQTFNTVANSWVRVAFTWTTAAGNTWMTPRIYTTSGAGNFYTDATQVVEASYPHTWTLGQTTRDAGKLSYPINLTQDEMTYCTWAKVSTDSYGSVRNLFDLVSSTTTSAVRVYIDAAGGTFSYELTDNDGNTSSAAITGSDFTDNDWHHIAVRLKADDAEGTKRLKCYWDGVEAVDTSATYFPRITTLDTIYHGSNDSGALHFVDGLMDRVQLVPYAMDPDQIAAIAAATIAPGNTPQIRLGGIGAITDARYDVPVEGRVTGIEITPAYISGTFYNNAQRITFELEELP